MKRDILVIFGGNSTEHDISVITAVEALNSMPIKGYNVIPIYIRDSVWYTGSRLFEIKSYIDFNPKGLNIVCVSGGKVYKAGHYKKFAGFCDADCAVLCTHGGDGENGSLQGLLEMNGIPYTSCDVRTSALCMDKHLTKLALNAMGVDTVEGREIVLPHGEGVIDEIESEFGYPVMVKPAEQGSSIGLTFAKNRKALEEGLTVAAAFGKRALVEKGLTDFAELNVAVATLNGKIEVSEVERPISANEFLTYGDKYIGGGKGMADLKREFPAKIDEKTAKYLKSTAKSVYEHLGLFGVVRMDFLKKDKVYLNEINTLPGSLAHYLFPKYSYSEFLRGLIESSIMRGAGKKAEYKTDVLRQLRGAIKK